MRPPFWRAITKIFSAEIRGAPCAAHGAMGSAGCTWGRADESWQAPAESPSLIGLAPVLQPRSAVLAGVVLGSASTGADLARQVLQQVWQRGADVLGVRLDGEAGPPVAVEHQQ